MLDPTAYPALADAIVAHAAAHALTLAALRATSSGWRDVVNAHLLRHVELEINADCRDLGALDTLALIPPRDARYPAFATSHVPPRDRTRLPFAPAHVRVLDLDVHDRVAALPAVAGLKPHTLRRFADGRWNDGMLVRAPPLACATLVDFLRPRGGAVALPPGARRYVLHTAWTPAAVGCAGQTARLAFGPHALREVVLVLRPHLARPDAAHRGLPAFVRDVLRLGFGVVQAGGTLTVVGGELVHPLQLGGEENDARWKLDLFERALWGIWQEEHGTVPPAGVRAVRLGDWLKELGGRRDAEGVWPAVEDSREPGCSCSTVRAFSVSI